MTLAIRDYLLVAIRAAVYALVALVPLVFYQKVMNPFILPKTVIFQVLVAIIVGAWAGLALLDRRYRPRATPLMIALGAYLGILAVASFFGTDLRLALWSYPERALGLVGLVHVAALIIALSSLSEVIPWRRVFALSVTVSALVGASIFAASLPPVNHFFLDTVIGNRPGTFFGNPTFAAGYLLINFFIALVFASQEGGRRRSLWVTIAAILGAAIFSTQTRGDILGLLAGLGLLVALQGARRLRPFSWRRSIATNWGFLAIAVGAIFLSAFLLTRQAPFWQKVPGLTRFTTNTAIEGDLQNRLYAWSAGMKAFKDRPILGYGWDNFYIAFSHYYDPRLMGNNFSETAWDKPHNVFLENLVSGGVLGLLAYLSFLAAFAYEALRSREHIGFKAIFAGALCAYLVRSAVIFDTIGTYLMLALAAAYIDSRFRASRGEEGLAGLVAPGFLEKKYPWAAAGPVLAAAVFAWMLNAPIVRGGLAQYQGVNFYIAARYLPQSLDAFREALASGSPYVDQIRLSFADVVKQAHESGIDYPDLDNLQKELVRELEMVIARHPANYFYYMNLAELKNTFWNFDVNYLKDAEMLANKSLEISPRRQQAYYIIAKSKLREGDKLSAREAFETAISLNPEAGDPRFFYGLLLYEMGEPGEGRKEIERASVLGRDPRTVAEAVTYGDLLGDANGDYASAVNLYRLALKFLGDGNPDQRAKILVKMGIAAYLGGDKASAAESFRGAMAGLDLRTLPIYPSLAPVLQELGIPLPTSKNTVP